MDDPLISLIITCFNDSAYVRKAVESAVKQTYENKEIILVDDGSDEQTRKILGTLESKIDQLIIQDNSGLSAARNRGISASKGELIMILDADDYLDPDFCKEAQKLYVDNFPIYKIITCQAYRFDEKGITDIFKPKGGDLNDFLFGNCALATSMFSRKDWLDVGGYDERMKLGYEDWEFFIRILAFGGQAFVISSPLYYYRQKQNSLRSEAYNIRYELWQYIYLKHPALYQNDFEKFVSHLINTLKHEEKEKMKIITGTDFRIGQLFLRPFRFIKALFRRRS